MIYRKSPLVKTDNELLLLPMDNHSGKVTGLLSRPIPGTVKKIRYCFASLFCKGCHVVPTSVL